MSGSTARQLFNAVQPVARANREVLAVVQDLARKAETVQDPQTRTLILDAAAKLLNASTEINTALQKVAEVRP